MENYCLLPYKPWLIKTRGEILPKIGDKITVIWFGEITDFEVNEVRGDKPFFKFNWTTDYSYIFVKMPYNG